MTKFSNHRRLVGKHTDLSEDVAQVFVTEDLWRRAASNPDYFSEKLALQDLAQEMADRPAKVLPRLVELAMEATRSASAGISILDAEVGLFRWSGLRGELQAFEGATTPRNDSPCGVCMDWKEPILMDRPERAYAWIRDANITVPEVLLLPLMLKSGHALGTLWVVSAEPGLFNASHVRVLNELAAFAALALHMIQTEERLSAALIEQEMLTREMSHRVKNLFALTSGLVRMSARNATSMDGLVTDLTGRLNALASANALVRRSFADQALDTVGLDEIVRSVLLPYQGRRIAVTGPSVQVGQRGTNNVALIFHELATNSAKYGALSTPSGLLTVQWTVSESRVELAWIEAEGPATTPPVTAGFGSRLVEVTVRTFSGELEYDWRPEGLIVRLRVPAMALSA